MVEIVLLSSFVAVESAHAFSAFCPSVFTIKSLAVPQNQQQQIREGYIPASIFAIALAVIVSKLIHSNYPLFFGIVTVIFMVAVYEWALRGD